MGKKGADSITTSTHNNRAHLLARRSYNNKNHQFPPYCTLCRVRMLQAGSGSRSDTHVPQKLALRFSSYLLLVAHVHNHATIIYAIAYIL